MNDAISDNSLYVVATPIGNLEDITYRAVRVLSGVSLVAAEDTRRTRVLFDRWGITTPLTALHEHNETTVAPQLVQRLVGGASIALVSDAGTPLLSDPGYRLLNLAIEAGIPVCSVPGASAITAALSIAGLATDRFTFEGFPPSRQAARRSLFGSLSAESRTLVFFESSHRIKNCLEDMMQAFGGHRRAVICRELTKRFETTLRGELMNLRKMLESDPDQQKGEFVILVAGASANPEQELAKAQEMGRLLQEYLSDSQAARVAARVCGVDRRNLYHRMTKRVDEG